MYPCEPENDDSHLQTSILMTTYLPLQGLYNDLYVYLISEVHSVLKELAAGPPPPQLPEVPGADRLAALHALADEAELNGDLEAAERHHQERLLAATDAQVGTFSSKVCNLQSPSCM